jgi:hypothetical protein
MANNAFEAALLRQALVGFAACAEALFPENDYGAPDWRATDMVARAEAWWQAMPPAARQMVVAMFAAIEVGGPVLAPGFRRFSRLPPEERRALVSRWRSSSLMPLRFLGDAVKSSMTMIYLSHPLAMAYIGVKTTACPTEATHYFQAKHVPFVKTAGNEAKGEGAAQ